MHHLLRSFNPAVEPVLHAADSDEPSANRFAVAHVLLDEDVEDPSDEPWSIASKRRRQPHNRSSV